MIAMLASYILSRTLVPTLSKMLMPGEHMHGHAYKKRTIFTRYNDLRERAFERFQNAYGRLLEIFLHHRVFTLTVAGGVAIISLMLLRVIGTDFFPTTDTGLMKLHFRAPVGTRLEETSKIVLAASYPDSASAYFSCKMRTDAS